MKYYYNIQKGVIRYKTNTKKNIAGILASMAMVGGMAVPAIASPTTGPEAGPGCFGNWRAGSVQAINGEAPGTSNTGKLHFSQRAGENSTINAENRAACSAL